jgi:hypothetical protein
MDINGDGDVVAIDQTEEVLLRCGGRCYNRGYEVRENAVIRPGAIRESFY